MNWLIDIYEDEPLDFYEVNIDEKDLIEDPELAGSFYTKEKIDPKNIKLFKTE